MLGAPFKQKNEGKEDAIQIQEKRVESQVRRKEASPKKCFARRLVCNWSLQFS